MSKFFRPRSVIEPLEARIAPALLVNGANLLGGPHSPSTGDTSVGNHSVTVVQVLSGEAIVWFQDGNIDGISFGPNTNLVITGDVRGDIVGNLLPNGQLSDTDNNPLNGEDGGVLLPNNLLGLKTLPLKPELGSVGNIITGGSVQNVSINGQISGIYAGDGVFNAGSALLNNGAVQSTLGTLDYNPIKAGTQSTFTFTPQTALVEPGASIYNLNIAKGDQLQVIAGSGNASSVGKTTSGGSISNVTIQDAFANVNPLATISPPSYFLLAGDGGSGAKGFAGGSISNILEQTSSGQVFIHAGVGGNGASGAGGAGGSVTGLDLESSSSQYNVFAGNGGTGLPGGAGGSVTNNSYANNTPGGGVIVSANFTGPAPHGSGSDDVMIVDQGSGQMVLEENNANGTSFTPVTQSNTNGTVTLITPPTGAQDPIAAAAVNFYSTGAPDLVVAYAGSNSLVVYQNQGSGSFYNNNLPAGPGFETLSIGLSFSPAEMTLLDSSADDIVLAENVNGGSVLHLVTKTVISTGVSLSEQPGTVTLQFPCVGLVTASDGTVFAALSNGDIDAITVTGLAATPFSVSTAVAHVNGGIANIDIDSTGNHLLALSANGKTLSVFNEGSGSSNGSVGSLTVAASIGLTNLQAKPQVAHFVPGNQPDQIALLATAPTESQFDIYDPTLINGVNGSEITGYTPEKPLTTSDSLRNFAVVDSNNGSIGLAALQTSLGQFTFDSGLTTSFTDYALPFASKTVTVGAGTGGDGIDVGSKLGKGGAGGDIAGINANAHDLTLTAGTGGSSQAGAGGAGGSFNNPSDFKTAGGVKVAALLVADEAVSVTGGAGGSAMVAGGSQASGGVGGSVNGFSITLNSGGSDLFLTLVGGAGGTGDGGNGGAGGSVTGITATGHDGGLVATGGAGGDADAGSNAMSGNGGAGGSVSALSYQLTLDAQVAAIETTHSATITAGKGGESVTGFGGAGGMLQNIALTMQGANRTYNDPAVTPFLLDAYLDSTVTISLQAGKGGQGAKGGNGGGITNAEYSTIIAQRAEDNSIILPYAVLTLGAGSGGIGTTGNGGNGGSILLSKPISGVTSFDPDATSPTNNQSRTPLVVTAGNGGDGATKGGTGGSISGLVAQNSAFTDGTIISSTELLSALVLAGNGGDGASGPGGAGGSISSSLIAVESRALVDPTINTVTGVITGPPAVPEGGSLIVSAGTGGIGAGTATAKGGAGGAINQGQFGLVSTAAAVGMQILGGSGGVGVAAGGLGGGLNGIQMNITQSTAVPAVVLIAGTGGAADSASGIGGKGGSVTNLTEGKDENSSINLIQAGNGGANPLGKGGDGGSDQAIFTVGFIGRPSDGNTPLGVFDYIGTDEFAQGLYSGRGGVGVTNGVNGSVIDIVARQIAAISAAEDPTTQLFAPAARIAGITADLVGYDADRGSGVAGRDGVFNDSTGGDASPSQVIPQDGFILGTILQIPGLDVLQGGTFTS